ncbi:unnamed protein product [Peronospora belbahrii]|uniref:RZZ complex subunit KNTC1/ROD C-terminal domain-containing protein n=1 Tax=Peronospora belbahrii TaxID=622444 RepID=A0AAU9L7W6_9STRA|nr:unnamed protein product [Peronospora belbahrii]
MMTEPLLLAARELAHGSVSSLPLDVEVVASAISFKHLAVLFQSQSARNSVHLGVFKIDDKVDVEEPELFDLLSNMDTSVAIKANKCKWSLVWSPDLTFLVVSGQISCSESEYEGVLWIFTRSEWLTSTAVSIESTDSPLVLYIRPSTYLSAKHWNPTTSIMNVFFPTQSGSKVFVLSEDGVWLSVSVQLTKLALAAMNQSTSNDTAGIITMQGVKKLTEWHAGVTAACYDPESSILVVSGGVRDPSLDLLEKNVSSLSVWKVMHDNDRKEFGELLDFAMVVMGETKHLCDETKDGKTKQFDCMSISREKSIGLIASIKNTLSAPLKMMVGNETMKSRVTQGSICHLALAPNGNFVSMVDDLGRIAIRQIDVCADVLNWQEVEDETVGRTKANAIKMVMWLANDLVALMLSNERVMYSRFIISGKDETEFKSFASDSESDDTSGPYGRLVLIPAQHYRPVTGVLTGNVRTLAYEVKEFSSSEKESFAFTACELVIIGDVWVANQVCNLGITPFVELLLDAQKFEDALEAVALYGGSDIAINADSIHRHIWMQYRQKGAWFNGKCNDELASKDDLALQDLVLLSTRPRGLLQREECDEFLDALGHLRAISDKQWVLNECLHVVADDSAANMKRILEIAQDAFVCLDNGSEVVTELLQEKEDLERYMYRLETLRMILCKEDDMSTMSIVGDHTFDGATYARFRSSSIVTTAKQFAREGRVDAVKIIFSRHGWNVLPCWLNILELLPPSVPPSSYALLLPAVTAQVEGDDEVFVLSGLNGVDSECDDSSDPAVRVALLEENRLYDATEEELLKFEEYRSMEREGRNLAYREWLSRRILELDTRYGQLAFAYEMSRLATKCLYGWSDVDAKKPLEQLFLHTERLYKCVYLLHLSACCLLPLEDWSALSIRDQAMIVVGIDEKELAGDVASIIDWLNVVFVVQRQDRLYALDGLFSWLAQTILVKSSLSRLTLAAQLIQRSNPSIELTKRLIQSDTQVIKTALNIVYSVKVSEIIGDKPLSGNTSGFMQCHLTLVEQLWTIFQSLPARKENDPPEMAQLQVAVDEMEDLLITVDMLSKYEVASSPGELKYRMLTDSDSTTDDGSTSGPLYLLEQMCSFVFSGQCRDDKGHLGGKQWQDVLQDAFKLKEHAFGEQLSQQVILDVLMKHLLAPDCAYVEAAQDLVNHWIAFDVQAVEHVIDGLFMAIRVKLDSLTGYSENTNANAAYKSALSCIDIVRKLLSLPLWDEGNRGASNAKEHYEEVLSLELDTIQACELLDLLTYGAIKMSPSQLRAREAQDDALKIRLDALCQIFASDPTNFKPSMRAKEWLAQHSGSKAELSNDRTATDVWNEPLAAVMKLARLLRVDSHKLIIWMKGAYAALYCMDYDVAYDLTMQVIAEIPSKTDLVANDSGSSDKFTLPHLISLVLDLVSASSFRSWEKKRKLCCALLSATNASSTDLFAHQVTDLVVSCLKRIEAVQALMFELGLSDNDLEQRRLDGCNNTSSAESVLLNELKVVIGLLHEERHDHQYLLRLLQRGIQLIFAMSDTFASTENHDHNKSLSTFLQQMVQLCVEEAVELEVIRTASDPGDWQQYMELGFSYLVMLGDLSNYDKNFEAFCIDEVLSRLFTDERRHVSSVAPSDEILHTTDVVVRSLHHFFLLHASIAKESTVDNDVETLSSCRERFGTLSASYERARRVVTCADHLHKSTSSDAAPTAEQPNELQVLVPEQRYLVFVNLAQRCQERLVSQKKSQELEQMSMFFNTELDLERFSQDEGYRNNKILLLATKKEHFQLARQFASKYGIDEYECVLTYIKSALAFLPDGSQADRREQLDEAFAIEQVDILEEALQRPISFGDFLLKRSVTGAPSLYEAIDGTDHVGLLLVLRMILECSKRLNQESAETVVSSHVQPLFPLPKASIDRITLLFMCLKKLKDIADSLDDVASVDLKLIGVASTTSELLTPLASSRADMATNQQIAVEAARPLLTGKSIKFVTKILRKLHRVTPSSMVMIYFNDTLTNLWREHGAVATTEAKRADLASYAYKSCMPYLSVLSSEHLMLFHCFFLNGLDRESLPEIVAHINVGEEFYGQQLSGLQRFGTLLTLQKRVELVVHILTIFQSKYNSWQSSGPRSNDSSVSSTTSCLSVSWNLVQCDRKKQELQYLERQLTENLCCWMLAEIEQNELACDKIETKAKPTQSLQPVAVALRAWFAMDPRQQAANENTLHSTVLMELCQRVNCVELATLIMELVLRADGNEYDHDLVANAIVHSYKTTVTNLINRCMSPEEDGASISVEWVERLAWTWALGASATSSTRIAELEEYLRVTLRISCDEKGKAHTIYERIMMQLKESPSTLLKEIISSRNEELQTSAENSTLTKNVAALARDAVLSQWKQMVAVKEEKQKWTEAAVLSHVMCSCGATKGIDADNAAWDFGLYVKAVWSSLLTKHKMDESTKLQHIFKVPSRDILHQFAAVFEELLAFIEARHHDNNPNALHFAEMATLALSNLLVRHGDIHGGVEKLAQRGASAWHHEQNLAVQTRVHAQFEVGTVTQRPATLQIAEATTCWTALFARGVWSAQLLSWYTSYAFAKLSSEKEATEAVILTYWETSNIDIAIQLLLMCPFDDLREKHADRLWSYVRTLPQASHSWSTTMELSLLRFDVAVLVQNGLYASMVAFLLQGSKTNPALWTSSGAYVVCALVSKGEFAAAGRLTCALQHTHPLLWDLENARLVLANYLRSLASSSGPYKNINNINLSHLQHQVYVQTSSQFASALISKQYGGGH